MPRQLFTRPSPQDQGKFAPKLHIKDILTLNRIVYTPSVQSKKKLLELIAENVTLSIPTLASHDIFDGLVERERLGSTAVGHGVAIPHCRMNIEESIGSFILLKKGIDFNAPDNQPVDLVFSLLVPMEATDTHLELLASISTLFHEESMRETLRKASSREELFQRLTHAG